MIVPGTGSSLTSNSLSVEPSDTYNLQITPEHCQYVYRIHVETKFLKPYTRLLVPIAKFADNAVVLRVSKDTGQAIVSNEANSSVRIISYCDKLIVNCVADCVRELHYIFSLAFHV